MNPNARSHNALAQWDQRLLILHLAEIKLRSLNVSQVEQVYSTNAEQPDDMTDVHDSRRTKTRAIQKRNNTVKTQMWENP